MEEVRRLRIQRRLKGGPSANAEADAEGQVLPAFSISPLGRCYQGILSNGILQPGFVPFP
eukprot:131071-Pelagomonas_calceolata.AAC.3